MTRSEFVSLCLYLIYLKFNCRFKAKHDVRLIILNAGARLYLKHS